MNKKKILDQLQGLLFITSESIHTYKKAVRHSKNKKFMLFFSNCFLARIKHAEELKTSILSLGGKIKSGRDLPALLSNIWTDFKTTISPDAERTMLQDLNGQDFEAISLYNEILSAALLPESLREALIDQRNDVKETLVKIAELNFLYT